MKLKLNDKVVVVSGKDKGKEGKIMKILRNSNKITVEKLNIRTKHVKKKADKPGEKIQYEAPFNASNVMLVCPGCTKKTRIGYKVAEGAKKERICKKCNEILDKKPSTKK